MQSLAKVKQLADKVNDYKREVENSTKVLTIQQSITGKLPVVRLSSLPVVQSQCTHDSYHKFARNSLLRIDDLYARASCLCSPAMTRKPKRGTERTCTLHTHSHHRSHALRNWELCPERLLVLVLCAAIRFCFLFNDLLLVAKKKKEGQYSFKRLLFTKDIQLQDVPDLKGMRRHGVSCRVAVGLFRSRPTNVGHTGSDSTFEIVATTDKNAVTLRFSCPEFEEKMEWMRDITNAMANRISVSTAVRLRSFSESGSPPVAIASLPSSPSTTASESPVPPPRGSLSSSPSSSRPTLPSV
jgi:hypothetical protein